MDNYETSTRSITIILILLCNRINDLSYNYDFERRFMKGKYKILILILCLFAFGCSYTDLVNRYNQSKETYKEIKKDATLIKKDIKTIEQDAKDLGLR